VKIIPLLNQGCQKLGPSHSTISLSTCSGISPVLRVSVSQVLHPSSIDNIALLNGSFVSIGDIRANSVLALNLRA
jgi:hypothetical protein